MTADSFEKMYDENVRLRQEIQANEELIKALTAEQCQWIDGVKEIERLKDGIRLALDGYKGSAGDLNVLCDTLEALCTSKH